MKSPLPTNTTKTYKIRTTTDIYNAVTKDNIDGFLIDFETWLRSCVELKEIVPNEVIKIAEAGFTWSDDCDNGTLKSVNIEIKDHE